MTQHILTIKADETTLTAIIDILRHSDTLAESLCDNKGLSWPEAVEAASNITLTFNEPA
jgi:hypothetical protein